MDYQDPQPWSNEPSPIGPPGYAPPPPANGKAIAALVLGIAGCCLVGVLGAIPALILGIMAKNEVDQSPGQYSDGSRGMAVAGIVLGIIGMVVSVLALLFIIFGAGALQEFIDDYCAENPDEPECEDYESNNAVTPRFLDAWLSPPHIRA